MFLTWLPAIGVGTILGSIGGSLVTGFFKRRNRIAETSKLIDQRIKFQLDTAWAEVDRSNRLREEDRLTWLEVVDNQNRWYATALRNLNDQVCEQRKQLREYEVLYDGVSSQG